ncbi:alpha/beta fold hydrolase [Nocardia panacis]|uniref:alpha/beta fold hydrolase n=1 Tax=Nocardia panacis TaxID=2340916 RepID=UPI001EF139E9|nr:alpha/beta fold hydrolase [Nocardia panacis]
MSSEVDRFMVHRDGVAIAVSRGGRGMPLVLCPGLVSTQAELYELIGLLRRDFDVVSLDLRGHGLSAAAAQYSFTAFLDDFVTVMTEVASRHPCSSATPTART